MEKRSYDRIGETVFSATLQNGLKVIVVKKSGYHKRYAFFATDYGGADRRFKLAGKWIDTPKGVAHFLEHKMFDTPDGNALTLLSANGASPNAFTSTEMTAYHFECTENFEENLRVLLDFVSVPYFTAESVEKEKGIIGQEIKMVEDDPQYMMYYGLLKSLYKHNPIRDSVAGTIESISEITEKTLYDCHNVFYNPSNMVLCVVGDIDPERVLDIAEKTVVSGAGEVPQRDYGPPEALEPTAKSVASQLEVSMPLFFIGGKAEPAVKGKPYLKNDLTGSLAMSLIAGSSSPLFLRLYESGLINNEFAAQFDSASGVAYSIIGGESRDPNRVFEELKAEISRITASGPDEGHFLRTKKSMEGRQLRALNSFDAISAGCANGYFRGYDFFELADILAEIEISDIISFAEKNLKPDNMAISMIEPVKKEK